MTEFLFENGQTVESKISGFSGMITSRADHLNGCNRYWVQPRIDKDGKIPDGYWIDEGELMAIKPAEIEPKNKDRGGFHSRIK